MPRKSKAAAAVSAPPVPAPQALPDELTIYTVGDLHRQWTTWLATVPPDSTVPAMDAHAVGQVDAAGLQLLISLDGALARRGAALSLQAPSSALSTGCEAIGLGGWLQAHTAAPADGSTGATA